MYHFISDLSRNVLTGTIPRGWADAKLESIESNQFNGTISPELGNLVNLSERRLSSNNFNGSLPDHFENYSKLQKLEMISSGFEGSIAVLEAEFDQVSPPELLKQFEEAMMLSALRRHGTSNEEKE
nr:probable LRR receptor-like serine/threonine-protein kinase At1g07650 [Spinacia oleracea]